MFILCILDIPAIFAIAAAPQSLVQGLGSGKELHVPKNLTEIAALSGVPAEQAKRTVIITQRMNKTLQSGQKFVDQWQIYWKNSERWTNPLMGWTSSADPMSNVKVNFSSFERSSVLFYIGTLVEF